jgi:HSP20 family protein
MRRFFASGVYVETVREESCVPDCCVGYVGVFPAYYERKSEQTYLEVLVMLMRFDPFREFDRLTQQAFGTNGRPAVMPMDAYRKGDEFLVHFDLPGVDPSSIELTVEKNVLTVSAERHWDSKDQEFIANERPQGSFSRQLFLGDTLDADHVEAAYDRGVLTLTIPMAEQAKPRKIEVTSGDQQSKAIEANSTAA